MKVNLLITILLFTALVSCDQKKVQVPNADQANIALAKKLFEHFNNHNWTEMAALYADSADFRDPSLGQDIIKQSRKQTIDKYVELAKMFPDVKDEVTSVYPSGDKNVIIEFVSSGTAPDGSKWTLPICTIFTIENGMIIKDYTYYDNQQ